MPANRGRQGLAPSIESYAHPGIATALLFSVAVTFVAFATPVISFAYRNPPLHIAFETAEMLIASLAAFLLFGRYRQSSRASDLGLVFVLDVLAIANVAFSLVPTIFLQGRPDVRFGWAAATIRLVASATLVASARISPETRTARRLSAIVPLSAACFLVAIVAGPSLALVDRLPDPLDAFVITQTAEMLMTGHPVFMLIQGLNMVLLGTGAIGFARRGRDKDDELMSWIAAACVFGAFARLNYLLFPSLYTQYVYTGDFLRLGFYAMLLIGGAREIRSFWASRAQAAVADERRRLARDLHDGAAQELLFILAQTRRLARGSGASEDLKALESAADRAVFESRRAIHALSTAPQRSVAVVLREACDELSHRWGNEIKLELDEVVVGDAVTEQLVRIAREAVTNAIKHASPSSIQVHLRSVPRDGAASLVLTVEDDGRGFTPDVRTPSGTRFGLISMRERVAILGGELDLVSTPGEGTRITVQIPANAG